MRPLRLLLDGFGSYREPADVDFSDVDFFALVGPTGSGKSTVIDGLCFALYGTVPRWGRENVIAHALAPSANACRVGLVFETGGARYAAVRQLTRDSRGRVHTKEARLDRLDPTVPAEAELSALLEASVEQLAEGDRVTSAVANLLGLGYEHFTQCVLLPQGRFAEFLQAKAGERQDLLVELLAFGVYERVGQLARQRVQLLDRDRALLQGQRDQLVDATDEAEELAKGRVRELVQLSESIAAQLKNRDVAESRAIEARSAADDNRANLGQLERVAVPESTADLAARIAEATATVAAARARRDEAERAEDDARLGRERLGDVGRYQGWRDAYRAAADASQALVERQEALDGVVAVESGARKRLEAAEGALDEAERAEAAARSANEAAAIAARLQVGERCPVCQQTISLLPHHEPPADLKTTAAALGAAKRQHRSCLTESEQARADVEAARRRVRETEQLLDGHLAALAGAPSESVVEATLDAIGAADEALEAAAAAARSARAVLGRAETERGELDAAEQAARAELNRTRDALAALAPPAVSGTDLATDWRTLIGWVQGERDRRAGAQAELDGVAAARRQEVTRIEAVVRALLGEHGIGDTDDVAAAPVRVAERRVEAEGALAVVQAKRERAATLDAQLGDCAEQMAVAGLLGDLLRSNQFERWLCGEALDSLVTEASTTLMELSGGQYELSRDDRNEFVVIDYNDAGTQRPVHTLSGGETFQASLALALALSRQVVSLSGGRRDLDSMFLDEGFGTLDENNLDTVASTLERLAADKDRMVGVVTHVTALAERVPVQFVVTRDATSSHVTKVQL